MLRYLQPESPYHYTTLPLGKVQESKNAMLSSSAVLQCVSIVVCTASLVRTFMFLGFVPVAPGTHRLAVSGDLMYLAYTTQSDDDSASDSDGCE